MPLLRMPATHGQLLCGSPDQVDARSCRGCFCSPCFLWLCLVGLVPPLHGAARSFWGCDTHTIWDAFQLSTYPHTLVSCHHTVVHRGVGPLHVCKDSCVGKGCRLGPSCLDGECCRLHAVAHASAFAGRTFLVLMHHMLVSQGGFDIVVCSSSSSSFWVLCILLCNTIFNKLDYTLLMVLLGTVGVGTAHLPSTCLSQFLRRGQQSALK